MPSKSFLAEALKVTLIIRNPTRLRLVQWVNDEWTKFNLGFYFGDHDVMDNAIFNTLVQVLAAENKKLPADAANTLRNSVDLTNGPLDAVKAMATAADKAIDID